MTAVSHVTTHVLDAVKGAPARDVLVQLLERDGGDHWRIVAEAATDADGRATRLGPGSLPAGAYRLRFDTGAYFAEQGVDTFYPEALLTFAVGGARHYHVPLLLSPFAYSTYRGS